MAILVYAEHDNVSLKSATLNVVAAAQAIGGDVHILVAVKVHKPQQMQQLKLQAYQKYYWQTMQLMRTN
jgi:electron transfer flavoprotein alpha subunit